MIVQRLFSKLIQAIALKKPPMSACEHRLNAWFMTELGQRLLTEEQRKINQVLSSRIVRCLLQLDMGVYRPLFDTHTVGCGILCSTLPNRAPCPVICCHPEHLPIEPESVDLIILHHVLDYCDNPYDTLREAAQALVPGGQMILLSFNPWSLWGLRGLLERRSGRLPWCARFMPFFRLHDGLQVLGLSVEERDVIMYGWPLSPRPWHKYIVWLAYLYRRLFYALGAVNVIVVRKRVPGVIPLAQRWQKQIINSGSIARSTIKG